MQRDQAAYDRQPQPEAALGAVRCLGAPREEIEYLSQHPGIDPFALVAHVRDDPIAIALGREDDLLPLPAVLGGVVQQVGEDLNHPVRVDVDGQPVGRDRDAQGLALLAKQRESDLGGLRRDGGELHALSVQFDLAAGDARDIEQIVDQPTQVRNLALDDLELGIDLAAAAEDLERGHDRCQGVAQLVTQHGQELVLVVELALRLARRLFVGARLRDVVAHDERVRAVRPLRHSRDLLHPDDRAVLEHLAKGDHAQRARIGKAVRQVAGHLDVVARIDDAEDVLPEQLGRGVAEVLEGEAVHIAHHAAAVHGEEHRGRLIVEQARAPFAEAQFRLGALPLAQEVQLHDGEARLRRGGLDEVQLLTAQFAVLDDVVENEEIEPVGPLEERVPQQALDRHLPVHELVGAIQDQGRMRGRAVADERSAGASDLARGVCEELQRIHGVRRRDVAIGAQPLAESDCLLPRELHVVDERTIDSKGRPDDLYDRPKDFGSGAAAQDRAAQAVDGPRELQSPLLACHVRNPVVVSITRGEISIARAALRPIAPAATPRGGRRRNCIGRQKRARNGPAAAL